MLVVFSRAVDAGNQDDGRAGGIEFQFHDRQRAQLAAICSRDDGFRICRVLDFRQTPALANFADDPFGCFDADVRADQRRFQFGQETTHRSAAPAKNVRTSRVMKSRVFFHRALQSIQAFVEETHIGDRQLIV